VTLGGTFTIGGDLEVGRLGFSYGPAVSEALIAEALHPYADALVVATKGGLERGGPGEWSRNGRPEHLREACEASLRRLRVDRIDLYQPHAPDPDVPYEDSVGTLKELQDEGRIRHVGVSNVTVAQLEQARAIVDVVTVQNRSFVALRYLATAIPKTCSTSAIATAAGSSRGFRSRPVSSRSPAAPSPTSPSATTRRPARSRSRGCCSAHR
jgi:aryl-alcohol dehydrogenase-like predicted oxidoreductase